VQKPAGMSFSELGRPPMRACLAYQGINMFGAVGCARISKGGIAASANDLVSFRERHETFSVVSEMVSVV
jgi:hypothetical protein